MRRSFRKYHFLPLDFIPLTDSSDRPLRLQPFYFSGGGSAPDTPDYKGAAEAQGQADKETAVVNAAYGRPNQVNPTGSQSWSFKGKDINNPQPGDWVVTNTLSPDQQKLYDMDTQNSLKLQGVAGSAVDRVGSQLGSSFDMSKVSSRPDQSNIDAITKQLAQLQGVQSRSGQLPSSVADFQGMADTASKANYADTTKYYDDRFAKDQAATETQLRNQGLQPGTEAYNNALLEFNRNKNDAYGAAANQAVAAGNQVANQNFQNLLNSTNAQQGLDTDSQTAMIQAINARSAGTQSQEQLRQQQIQEQAYLRSLPLNEANALRTGNQVSAPQFGSYSNGMANSAPMYQATNDLYGNQIADYNAGQANKSSQTSGALAAVGTAAAMYF